MKNFISFDRMLLLAMVVFLAILFFTHSCSSDEDESINRMKQLYEKTQNEVEGINVNIQSLKDDVVDLKKEIDSLGISRDKTIKRFNYEISRMEDVFRTSDDTLIVNAYLRCWTERLYGLPGFFQSSSINIGTTAGSKNSSAGRELLSSDEYSD